MNAPLIESRPSPLFVAGIVAGMIQAGGGAVDASGFSRKSRCKSCAADEDAVLFGAAWLVVNDGLDLQVEKRATGCVFWRC
jgi:hypothetical protein